MLSSSTNDLILSPGAGYPMKRLLPRRPTPHPNIFRSTWQSKSCCAFMVVVTMVLSSFFHAQRYSGIGRYHGLKIMTQTNQVTKNNQIHTAKHGKWSEEKGVSLQSLRKRASLFVQKDQIEETEFYWQLPPGTLKPHGILFLAHGCSHSGSDWWPNDPKTCPSCLGLPEERSIVNLAHSSRFRMVTVALSSRNRETKCWSTVDGALVAKVLKHFQSLFPNIPTFALGASSGGRFVSSILPQAMTQVSAPLAGYISEIMRPDPNNQLSGPDAPDSAFITMPKDPGTREAVKIFVDRQTAGGKNSKHIQVREHGIASSFFHKRIPSVSPLLSEKLAHALQKARLINDQTLELVVDPRREMEWKAALRPVLVANPSYKDDLIADRSPISEVMNVAYGRHEMTVDGVEEALEWLVSLQRKVKA